MTAEPNSPDHNDVTVQPLPEIAPDKAPLMGEAQETALAAIEKEYSFSAEAKSIAPEERREDDAVVERVGKLEHEVGWVLVTAGIIGMIVPGILGTPFLLMGAFALWPGNRKRVEKWRKGHSPKFFHGSMKQINRFLDDLERRYPRSKKR